MSQWRALYCLRKDETMCLLSLDTDTLGLLMEQVTWRDLQPKMWQNAGHALHVQHARVVH